MGVIPSESGSSGRHRLESTGNESFNGKKEKIVIKVTIVDKVNKIMMAIVLVSVVLPAAVNVHWLKNNSALWPDCPTFSQMLQPVETRLFAITTRHKKSVCGL
jgi:hypothetical protein